MRSETDVIPRPDYRVLPDEAHGYVMYEADDRPGRVESVSFNGMGGTLQERKPTHSRWYCHLPTSGPWITVALSRSNGSN
jgi:hypothetical protein